MNDDFLKELEDVEPDPTWVMAEALWKLLKEQETGEGGSRMMIEMLYSMFQEWGITEDKFNAAVLHACREWDL